MRLVLAISTVTLVVSVAALVLVLLLFITEPWDSKSTVSAPPPPTTSFCETLTQQMADTVNETVAQSLLQKWRRAGCQASELSPETSAPTPAPIPTPVPGTLVATFTGKGALLYSPQFKIPKNPFIIELITDGSYHVKVRYAALHSASDLMVLSKPGAYLRFSSHVELFPTTDYHLTVEPWSGTPANTEWTVNIKTPEKW